MEVLNLNQIQEDVLQNGVFVKQLTLKAGTIAKGHKHKYDHTSILAQGIVILSVDGKDREITAPAVLNIEAGKSHSIAAVSDALWYCIHATDVENIEDIEDSIVEVA